MHPLSPDDAPARRHRLDTPRGGPPLGLVARSGAPVDRCPLAGADPAADLGTACAAGLPHLPRRRAPATSGCPRRSVVTAGWTRAAGARSARARRGRPLSVPVAPPPAGTFAPPQAAGRGPRTVGPGPRTAVRPLPSTTDHESQRARVPSRCHVVSWAIEHEPFSVVHGPNRRTRRSLPPHLTRRGPPATRSPHAAL